jgi:hypothetical protein
VPTTKRKPATVWKLVEAQCNQLTDAVAGARTPFLLSLVWAFIWAWALYSSEFGYLGSFYRQRLDASLLHASEVGATGEQQFRIDCNRVTAGTLSKDLKESTKLAPEKREACESALKGRRAWAEKAYLDSTEMSFPGGFPKIQVSDLGVIGQGGLLLILAWLFYALRRENHAIRTFVDLDARTRKNGGLLPGSLILEPQETFFSAEHLAYAYHAVSQKFVFIFSRYYRPLLVTTVLLVSIPAIIASLHVISDLFDVIDYDWARPLTFRFVLEVVLLVLVWFVTIKTTGHVLDSSLLLNAWYLASKNVWYTEWDENTDDPASRVRVNVREQTAEVASKELS